MSGAARVVLRPLLLLGGLLAAGLALRLLPDGGAAGLLAHTHRAGAGARLAELVLVGAALCAVGVPRQVVCYAAGLAFGAAGGVAAALAAQVLGCAADFYWARLLGRRWAASRIRGSLARLERTLAARPFVATLTLRLLPVGNNLLLNLAAGVSGVAAPAFLAGSAAGYLPQTIVFALAGGGTQVGHAPQVALAVALFAVSSALGVWLLRHDGGVAAGRGRAG